MSNLWKAPPKPLKSTSNAVRGSIKCESVRGREKRELSDHKWHFWDFMYVCHSRELLVKKADRATLVTCNKVKGLTACSNPLLLAGVRKKTA